MKLLASFSGGKDSILSLDRAIEQGDEIVGLITTMKGDESWFHEIGTDLLDKISSAMNIPIYKIQVRGGAEYTADFVDNLKRIAEETKADGIIFGDIDLKEHRYWCEDIAEDAGIEAVFPLWQGDRRALVFEFLDKGYKTKIKKVDKKKLTKDYLGKDLSRELIEEFDRLNIDACGENGEYHTLVYDGKIFADKVELECKNIYEDDWSLIIEME